MKKINIYTEKCISFIKQLFTSVQEDSVMLYSAQACYFAIVSTIPFLCLLISIASFLIPADIYTVFESYDIPQEIKGVIQEIIAQLLATQEVSLLSISAIAALWTASRGSDAVRAGLEKVYEVPISKKIFKQQFLSFVNTFILLFVIITNIVFVLFGEVIAKALYLTLLLDIITRFGAIIFFVLMCFVFALIYTETAKHSKNEEIRSNVLHHLPGAVFATLGWMLFSYFYALYIRYFPSASAIYGSLTAVCLIMLWLYVCMVILLLGAEVNKLMIKEKK